MKSKIRRIVNISATYATVHNFADVANNSISSIIWNSPSDMFLTKEEKEVLEKAQDVLQKLRNSTTQTDCSYYVEKVIEDVA